MLSGGFGAGGGGRRWGRAAALVLALGWPMTCGATAAGEIRIGVLAFLGQDAAVEEWSPVVRRLQEAMPERRVSLKHLDHRGLRDEAAAGRLDFVITNPGHYVELEAALGASRILTLESGPAKAPDRAIGSAVIVPTGRGDLNTLNDLRDQRVAIVAREGFGGFQLVWRELAALGIDPEQDLAALEVVGLPMNRVFEAVARGEADAGIVRACLPESRPEWKSAFRVLGARAEPDFPCATSTRLYPDWPLATLRKTPGELAKQVATALLSMQEAADGMAWAVPSDYQAVHDLFRELQIGPYAAMREPTLIALAERYWPWLAGLVTLLAAWTLYTVRVEHLVHARTAELRAALGARETMEERLRANQAQADHLARLSVLGEMSSTLAHELNQPLAAIANYAHSLVRRIDNGRLTEAAVRAAADEIAGQAGRAADVLAGIRSFAKKRPTSFARIEAAPVVAEAVALFRGMLANAPTVAVHDASPPGTLVEADPLQIQQVLLNLLKNGYDAAHDLPPERQALQVRLTRDGDTLHIAVRDAGRGLDPLSREHLFEPFYTSKAEGLGLGLSICRTIAEAHRGRLSAAPPDGEAGSEFILSLPVAPAANVSNAVPRHASDR